MINLKKIYIIIVIIIYKNDENKLFLPYKDKLLNFLFFLFFIVLKF